MTAEDKPTKHIVLGRSVISSKQQPFTIQDRIHLMETWRDNSQVQTQKKSLQERIDLLTTAGEILGMNSSYLEYLSEKDE